jgi:chromosome condensin MukBEF ATPase and DNA-binding subunit MukB
MHCLEILKRKNSEGPNPLTRAERREMAVQNLEDRLGVTVDRTDTMLGAMAGMELALMRKYEEWQTEQESKCKLSSDALARDIDSFAPPNEPEMSNDY